MARRGRRGVSGTVVGASDPLVKARGRLEILVKGFGQLSANLHEPLGKGHFLLSERRDILFGAHVTGLPGQIPVAVGNEPPVPRRILITFRQRVRIGVGVNAFCHEQGLGTGHDGPIRLVRGHGKLMFPGQQPSLVQLLLGFQNAIVDHFHGPAGTFSWAQVFHREFLVSFPVHIVRGIILIGWRNGIPEQLFFERGFACPFQKRMEGFTCLAVPTIHLHQMRNRSRDMFRRELDGHLPDFRGPVDAPAKMQLIHGDHPAANAFPHAMQPDGGDMMLGAGIMAAADVDRGSLQVIRDLSRRKDIGQCPGQAFGGRNPEATGISPGAGHNVFGVTGPGLPQPSVHQCLVDGFQLGFRHPANNHILTDGGAHVAVRVVFRQIGQREHLPGGHITRRQSHDDGDKSLLSLFHHIGALPRRERRCHVVMLVSALAVRPVLRRQDQGCRVGIRDESHGRRGRPGAEQLLIGFLPSPPEGFEA